MFFFRSKILKKQADDALIVLFLSTGKNRYIEVLFDRYFHLVFGTCLKYLKNETDSNDATSLIFEKLLINIKKQEIKNLGSWLFIAAKNHCLSTLRNKERESKRAKVIALDDYTDYAVSENQNTAFEKEAILQYLQEAISVLKNEQRICIELFYLKEKCYKQVSQITGFNLKEVKSHLQNGKRILKQLVLQKNEVFKK